MLFLKIHYRRADFSLQNELIILTKEWRKGIEYLPKNVKTYEKVRANRNLRNLQVGKMMIRGIIVRTKTRSQNSHINILKEYVYIYNMRIKKSDKYTNEREETINRALEILQLDEDKSFILYEFDKDIEKQNRIIELAIDIKRYFASSYWNGINDKNTVRPYLTIIRNLFKNQGFLFINKSFIYNTGENGKVKTTRYYIIKKE